MRRYALARARLPRAWPGRVRTRNLIPGCIDNRMFIRHSALIAFCFITGCDGLSDPAVDLATCISSGAQQVPNKTGASRDITCSSRSGDSVTAILSSTVELPDTIITRLQLSGIPREALYYSGPDRESAGHKVSLGPVSVFDPRYTDNRRYSKSSALGRGVRVRNVVAKADKDFVVRVVRAPDGKVDVIGFR